LFTFVLIIGENHDIYNKNEENILFISVHDGAKVSPSSQEQMELLTYGDKGIVNRAH
jgi:hypothetical protein